MKNTTEKSKFTAELLRPSKVAKNSFWAFIILPKIVSETLPRRGRTTIDGTINSHAFQSTLEPDGKLSHWLRVTKQLQQASHVQVGDMVTLEIAPVVQEPEPQVPADLRKALVECPQAKAVWDETSTIARVDWIHWIESAKQPKTRLRRVESACDMLGSGKRRVCCFDQSGFYSKSLSAPDT